MTLIHNRKGVAHMEQNDIRHIFSLYSGEDLAGDDVARTELCEMLCQESKTYIESLLRENVSDSVFQKYRQRMEQAAAAKAFYSLTLLDACSMPGSLSTSEIKLELSGRSEKAGELLHEKMRAIAPLIKESGFYFGRIRT